ncbi:MAG: ChaN family lipoprotein [Fimbriimonadaceae bacterium]
MLQTLLIPLVSTMLVASQDPYRLNIGEPGEVLIQPGTIVDTRTGKVVSAKDIAEEAAKHRFLFLGESHQTRAHHALQAEIMRELVGSGRKTVAGIEYLTRPMQAPLSRYASGEIDRAKFLEEAEWKTQWGFDFAAYAPIFEVAREHKLPMVALNVPRDWVRAVGRGGLSALTDEQRAELPKEIYLGNEDHRKVFVALTGGHPLAGERGENFYSAQVLWDEGMADTAIRWLEKNNPEDDVTFVVLTGSGHVMYDQGINFRVQRRLGKSGPSVVMLTSAEPVTVSRGLADYVYIALPEPKSD